MTFEGKHSGKWYAEVSCSPEIRPASDFTLMESPFLEGEWGPGDVISMSVEFVKRPWWAPWRRRFKPNAAFKVDRAPAPDKVDS